MLLLILDTDTAKQGVLDGITLCINVIIPALFPFFVVTGYMNTAILGMKIPGTQGILKFLRLPKGSESLLLLGLVGGYPVGAGLIADAYRHKQIDLRTARIMLGYCSNAGPAFIFGITSLLFSSPWIALVLWIIHILSALITGLILPRPSNSILKTHTSNSISIVSALKNSIVTCATVCGWIIIFKMILQYSNHYLGYSNTLFSIVLQGMMELSNGCLLLSEISAEYARFILCAGFLAFGGICVLMQTASAVESTGLGLYIPGKIVQTCISILLSMYFGSIIYSERYSLRISLPITAVSSMLIFLAKYCAEKSCGNLQAFHV